MDIKDTMKIIAHIITLKVKYISNLIDLIHLTASSIFFLLGKVFILNILLH